MPPIKALLSRWLDGRKCIVDPFARNCRLAHWRNDLNPDTAADFHVDAREFLKMISDMSDGIMLKSSSQTMRSPFVHSPEFPSTGTYPARRANASSSFNGTSFGMGRAG